MGKVKGKSSGRKIEKKPKGGRKQKKSEVPNPGQAVKKAKFKKLKKSKEEASSASGGSKPTLNGFVKQPTSAKWTALFKRELGLVEAHISRLNMLMQSLKTLMAGMTEEERVRCELGKRGSWRMICEMLDRARATLADSRLAARGILPPHLTTGKKGFGLTGTTWQPLGPELAERAAAMGLVDDDELQSERPLGPFNQGAEPDIKGDLEMSSVSDDSDSSDSDSSSGTASQSDTDIERMSVPNAQSKELKIQPQEALVRGKDENAIQANAFFVDLEPTPVDLNAINQSSKKSAKIDKAKSPRIKKANKLQIEKPAIKQNEKLTDDDEQPKPRKAKKLKTSEAGETIAAEAEPDRIAVDFAAVEAQLQAEVAEGLRAQEEQAKALRKEKKKRKRSTGEDDSTEEIMKKSKKEGSIKKRKAESKVDAEGVEIKKRKHRLHEG